MSNICIVASCNTRRTPNSDKNSSIKCFSFPKDPDLKQKWLQLCQVNEDYNKKICIKHFKEDDFVDGLKARLMCVQPTRLKKDVVPSLFLGTGVLTDEIIQKQIQTREDNVKKVMCRKKRQVRMSSTKSSIKVNSKGSMEYLSKLVPIAPKGQEISKLNNVNTIVQKALLTKDSTVPQWQKIALKKSITSEELMKVPNTKDAVIPQVDVNTESKAIILENNIDKLKPELADINMINEIQAGYSLHRLKILQHDNTIYKKKIITLLDEQKKLLARVKELEAKIESQKEDFIGKVKETFSHVLTPNQIDNILGKKKHIWWTTDEYSKASKLLHISKQAYKYVKDDMNYPLPCLSNVYKWYTKNETRSQPDKKQKHDENKENGQRIVDDEMLYDEVKHELIYEFTDEIKNMANVDHINQEDKEYTLKVHSVQLDHNIEYEIGGMDDNDDDHNESNGQGEHDVTKHEYNNDHNEFVIDHNEPSPMNDSDQPDQDEFYEELIVDYDYSDDEMFDIQNGICMEKDNG